MSSLSDCKAYILHHSAVLFYLNIWIVYVSDPTSCCRDQIKFSFKIGWQWKKQFQCVPFPKLVLISLKMLKVTTRQINLSELIIKMLS